MLNPANALRRLSSDRVILVLMFGVVALGLLNPRQAGQSLQFVTQAMIGMAPFLVIAIAFAGFAKASGFDQTLGRVFSGRPWATIVAAAATGALSPFCSCGVIPIMAAMLGAGVPLAPVLAFCLASPVMDPQMFILTAAGINLEFAIAKAFAAFGMGLLAGFAVIWLHRFGWLERPLNPVLERAACCSGTARVEESTAVQWRFWRDGDRRETFLEELRKTGWFLGKWLTVAFFLESMMLAFIPAEWVSHLVGGGRWTAVLLAALVGIPAYMNGFAAIPLVGGLIQMGMTPGAGLAFMTAGAVSSIPAALAVHALVRRSVFLLYLVLGFGGSVAAGLVYSLYDATASPGLHRLTAVQTDNRETKEPTAVTRFHDLPREDRNWLLELPKVELHLHLEGAIPFDALWQVIQDHGGDPQVPDREALAARFAYRDFTHFLEVWTWKNQFLRTEQDFVFISAAVASNLAGQNVRYAEVFYSPSDFAIHGLTPQGITRAIRRGLDQVPEIEIALIADLVRNGGPETAARTLEQIAEVRNQGVIGIGLGGAEHAFPPQQFAAVFKQARELGLKTTAHAGEAAGPDSIWGALLDLEVDRIGHATRAVEDPALLNYLAQHAIPLELCPVSNLLTGVIPDIAAHPARRYFERGIPLSINSDDPAMFGTSIAEELASLMHHQGFTRSEIARLMISAVHSSWLDAERKRGLVMQIETYAANG